MASASYDEGTVSGFISDSPLARGLVRIGDGAIAHEDDAKLPDYFAEDYLFHRPGGDLGFDGVVAATTRTRRRGCRNDAVVP